MANKFTYTIKLNDESAPVEIMRTGSFHHASYGQFEITVETMQQIIENFEAGRVPADYNHSSLNDHPEEAVAAGWVQSLEIVEGDSHTSLMATVEWTDRAREFIASGEYRFVSPEFVFNFTDRESGEDKGAKLLAFAITNRPFLPDMAPLTLTDDGYKVEEDVALEEKFSKCLMLSSNRSLSEMLESVVRCFYRKHRDNEQVFYWVEDVREQNIVVREERAESSQLYSVGYTFNASENSAEFEPMQDWVKVQRDFVPIQASDDPSIDRTQGEGIMDEKVLRELLGLTEDQSIEDAITALKEGSAKAEALEGQVAELNTKIDGLTKEAEEKVLDAGDEDTVQLTEENTKLNEEVEVLRGENTKLNERVNSLEETANRKAGEDRIKLAIENRKALPAELAEGGAMYKLAFENGTLFDEIIEARAEINAAQFTEEGETGGEGESESAVDPHVEYQAKVSEVARKLVSDKVEPNYTQARAKAREIVASEHPDLVASLKSDK